MKNWHERVTDFWIKYFPIIIIIVMLFILIYYAFGAFLKLS